MTVAQLAEQGPPAPAQEKRRRQISSQALATMSAVSMLIVLPLATATENEMDWKEWAITSSAQAAALLSVGLVTAAVTLAALCLGCVALPRRFVARPLRVAEEEVPTPAPEAEVSEEEAENSEEEMLWTREGFYVDHDGRWIRIGHYDETESDGEVGVELGGGEIPAAPGPGVMAHCHVCTQTTVTYTAARGATQPRFLEQRGLAQLTWSGGVWVVADPAPAWSRVMATQSVTTYVGGRFQILGHREHGVFWPTGRQYQTGGRY